MNEFQRRALIQLRDALEVCEAHDLDHLVISVEGQYDMPTGCASSEAVQACLDGKDYYSKP